MTPLKGACLIGQSGGPTSVINASVLGCVKAALKSNNISTVYGAAHGIKGVLNDQLYNLSLEDPNELEYLKYTPAAALGSCRYKLKDFLVDDTDYKRLLDVFQKYDIRYFFYNGGNDSMDTCSKISSYLSSNGYECKVMGIPKTIDNDLAGTDHCPGYGSAAKYVATTCREIYRDATVYDASSITVIEIMGRNAGWLTAASCLASHNGQGPDLVYLPEVPFDLADFIADVKKIYDKKGDVLVAVSEGIVDKSGSYISSYFSDSSKDKDAFGHSKMGGLAVSLANFISTKIDAKVKGVEFGIIQRCAAHLASKADLEEAYLAGEHAFLSAEAGETDKMVAFKRASSSEYKCELTLIDLVEVANLEKKIPREWINEAGNGLLKPFIDYALPLIQGSVDTPFEDGLPRYANLKRIIASK